MLAVIGAYGTLTSLLIPGTLATIGMASSPPTTGMGGDAADPGPDGADHRERPQQVLRQGVDGPAQLLLDAVHDHGGVGGDGAGGIGDHEGAAFPGHLLQALPLGPEPVAVDGVVDLAGHLPGVLRAAPLVDVAEARVGQ